MTTCLASLRTGSSFLFAALGFLPDSAAQSVTATAVAHTTLTVTAGTNTQTLPVGTNLTPGVTLSASAVTPGFPSPIYQSAYTTISLSTSSGYPALNIVESSFVSGGFGAIASTGPHETVWRLSSAQPVEGTLTVRYQGSTTTLSGSAQVDVYNDGSFDWTRTTGVSQQVWRAVVTVSALTEFRTRTSSMFLGGGVTLDLEFRPHVLIHDQGPLVTHAGGGSGGAHASALQNAAPVNLGSYGFNANSAGSLGVADDFAVCDPAGWDIDAIEVLAYQTGAGTAPSTLTGLFVEFYSGIPGSGGVPVAGSPGIGVNLLTGKPATNTWSGVYRTLVSDISTATDRPLMRVRAALPAPLHLAPGVYWVQYGVTGSLASGPWAAPITVWNRGATGNARQRNGAAWTNLTSGAALHAQGVPFRLFGGRPDPLGSITTLSPGCGTTQLRVTGAPVVGGFLHAELSNLAPGGLPLIGLDFVASPTPFCGCTVGHGWAVILFGTSWNLDVPMATSFCGLPIVVQGTELWGIGGCVAPQITFTETVRAVLR